MGEARGELREQASRFLAVVARASTVAAAEGFLADLRSEHSDATHHCFAWRVGWPPAERASDDGEPAGTAGQPILRVLRGAGLTDVVAVVVRWFGGTRLGKGGLARAYAGATLAALATLPTRLEPPRKELRILAPHTRVGAVKRLLRPPAVALVEESYGEVASLRLSASIAALPRLLERLAELGIAPDEGDDALE